MFTILCVQVYYVMAWSAPYTLFVHHVNIESVFFVVCLTFAAIQNRHSESTGTASDGGKVPVSDDDRHRKQIGLLYMSLLRQLLQYLRD